MRPNVLVGVFFSWFLKPGKLGIKAALVHSCYFKRSFGMALLLEGIFLDFLQYKEHNPLTQTKIISSYRLHGKEDAPTLRYFGVFLDQDQQTWTLMRQGCN